MEFFCSYFSIFFWDVKSLLVKMEYIGFLGVCVFYSLNLMFIWVDLYIIVEWFMKVKEWYRWWMRLVMLFELWWFGYGEFSIGYVVGSKLVFIWDVFCKCCKEWIYFLRLRVGVYLYIRISVVGCYEWFYLCF